MAIVEFDRTLHMQVTFIARVGSHERPRDDQVVCIEALMSLSIRQRGAAHTNVTTLPCPVREMVACGGPVTLTAAIIERDIRRATCRQPEQTILVVVGALHVCRCKL